MAYSIRSFCFSGSAVVFVAIPAIIAFWRSRKNPYISFRLPSITAFTSVLLLFVPLSRAIHASFVVQNRCAMEMVEEYILVSLVSLVYVIRVAVLHYKFQWGREKLRLFEINDKQSPVSDVDTHYYDRRHWIATLNLWRFMFAVALVEALPLVYALKTETQRLSMNSSDICVNTFWMTSFAVIGCVHFVVGLFFTLKIPKSMDLFGIRKEQLATGCTFLFGVAFLPVEKMTNGFGKPLPVCNMIFLVAFCLIGLLLINMYPLYLVYTDKRLIKDLKKAKLEGNDIGFFSVLADAEGLEAFREYLIQEFSIENLLFFEHVTAYKKTATALLEEKKSAGIAEILRRAHETYHRFVGKDSLLEVNLSAVAKRKLQCVEYIDEYAVGKQLLRVSEEKSDILSLKLVGICECRALPNLFDEALEEVVRVMKFDTFTRFQLTAKYVQIQARLLKKRRSSNVMLELCGDVKHLV